LHERPDAEIERRRQAPTFPLGIVDDASLPDAACDVPDSGAKSVGVLVLRDFKK